jgi:hypothetical protein
MNISDVIYNMLKLTLNQWVEGSSPSGVTRKALKYRHLGVFLFYNLCKSSLFYSFYCWFSAFL